MLAVLGSIAAAAGVIALAPATAGAASCSFSSGTATVNVALTTASDVATVKRSGSAIQMGGVNCQTATVNNTDKIAVTGTAADSQGIVFDLSGGALGPGKTAETGTGAISEIELTVDLRGPGPEAFPNDEEIRVHGGTGADKAVFGTAGATLNTDSDVDLTFSGLDQVELDGTAGADVLSVAGGGAAGSPLARPSDIDGGAGADTLTGGPKSDTIAGLSEDDVLSGGAGDIDTLAGGFGNDNLSGGDGVDYLDGGAGAGADNLSGGEGSDSLDGGAGIDGLSGGRDNDTINPNGGPALDGADDIAGGSGSDSLNLSNRTNNLIVTLDGIANDGGDAAADGTAEEGDNVRPDIENVSLGSGNDQADARFATARLFPHTFDGSGGNDSLYGGDEPDFLYGGDGNNNLSGGEGSDSLSGGAGADGLSGGEGGDSVYPDNGNDTIDAGGGDDYIIGGPAGDGSDSFMGGTGVDYLDEGYSGFPPRTQDMSIDLDNVADDGIAGEGDNVRADIEQINTGLGNDTINIATVAANALAADNTVTSGGGNDTVKTGGGEDVVYGGTGNDDITGGAGEDSAFGEDGADVFRMQDGFFDHIDGGANDAVTDTGTFDAYDEKVNFP
jgi:Ca2+-binding RTX toxin-like protein